jgi:hypothetical protein
VSAVPANLRPFVDVLGEGGAIAFLLEFGGATFYLAEDPKGGSEILQHLGEAKGRELVARLRQGTAHPYLRFPVAKKWLAATMRRDGAPYSAIARRLHVTDSTVRSWLAASSPQLDLFQNNK